MHKLIQPVLFTLVLVCSLAAAPGTALADNHAAQKAVLVTGASTGIGRNITETLAGKGYFVYAGARKDADLAELNALDNVEAVRLDVTVQADIDAAVEQITKAGRGLHGIINNAGVGVFSPMNQTPEDDIDFVFNVNIYGPYRVNKAFMPLLIESKGRTTIIGSISGYISGAQSGTYSMSKAAVESYTDALAAEMAESGVHVSIIEPGGYKSKIREKVVLHQVGKSKDEMSEAEKEALEQMVARNAELKDPDEVSAAALHAMFAENPRPRYMVVPNQEQAEATIRNALTKVAQLNAHQEYSYTLEELTAMLAELVAEQGE